MTELLIIIIVALLIAIIALYLRKQDLKRGVAVLEEMLEKCDLRIGRVAQECSRAMQLYQEQYDVNLRIQIANQALKDELQACKEKIKELENPPNNIDY